MLFNRLIVAGLVAAVLTACSNESPTAGDSAGADQYADTIFYGGPIYTGVESTPTVEAVAVKDGMIVATGPLAAIDSMINETEIIDLKGAAMFPGFTDAHAHLLGIGMRELTLNLEGVGSIDELADIIAANVGESDDGAVIYGRGWIETGWPEARFPNRGDLDPVSPDNPVILYRADGHAALVNSAALAAAEIDGETVDPDGGRIEKDADGQPTGILVDKAMGLIASLIAAPTESQKNEAYRVGGEVYAAYGWTGVHNMSVDPDDVSMMESLSNSNKLGIRVYNSINQGGLAALAQSDHRANNNARIITRAMKLYSDGALGSRGAALSAPYSDQPDTSGLILMERDEAMALFDRAIEAGVQVNTHAIGDRANKLVLDWYAEAFARNQDAGDLRWRIEHAQILHTEDIPRFADLGVIASMQPSHAIGDLYFAPDRLGPDRLDGAYAWRSLIDAGAIIAGGSDAPVERGDPLIEFYAAVARKGLDGYQDENWRPDQAVTRAEALKMFTLWPAYASFQEGLLGTIEPGKRADFTVFSSNIMTAPEDEILNAEAVMTVVDGVIVYQSDREQ